MRELRRDDAIQPPTVPLRIREELNGTCRYDGQDRCVFYGLVRQEPADRKDVVEMNSQIPREVTR